MRSRRERRERGERQHPEHVPGQHPAERDEQRDARPARRRDRLAAPPGKPAAGEHARRRAPTLITLCSASVSPPAPTARPIRLGTLSLVTSAALRAEVGDVQAERDQARRADEHARQRASRAAPARAARRVQQARRARPESGLPPEALNAAAITNAAPAPISRRRERQHQASQSGRPRIGRVVGLDGHDAAAGAQQQIEAEHDAEAASGSRCGRPPAPTRARSGSARRARPPARGSRPSSRAHFHTSSDRAEAREHEHRLQRPEGARDARAARRRTSAA